MGGGYQRAPGDSLQPIADSIKENSERATRLEAASGTSTANLVAQVKAAIVGISAQVAAAVAALPSITVPGNVRSVSGYIMGREVYGIDTPAFNITGGRVAGWWETATGRAGTAVSSRRFKDNINPIELDKFRGVLAIGIYHFNYIAELRKRDDPDYEHYVGPEYHVGTNVGAIAEELHEAGLWEFVIYEHEDDGVSLRRDADGEPIPYGIHDSLMAYAVIPVVQDHDRRLEAIEELLGIRGE